MYDILQLNDMLVPELLDIAEQQNITDTKNLEKQELIYKILDKQTAMTADENNDKKEVVTEKPKRKRIVRSAAKKEIAGDIPEEETLVDEKPKAKKP